MKKEGGGGDVVGGADGIDFSLMYERLDLCGGAIAASTPCLSASISVSVHLIITLSHCIFLNMSDWVSICLPLRLSLH